MKQIVSLLTPLQIIYIAIAIMTTMSVAAYRQNNAPTNQIPVQQMQISPVQYQQPTTQAEGNEPTVPPNPSLAPTSYSFVPSEVPAPSAYKVECVGGTVRVCEAGTCECVSN